PARRMRRGSAQRLVRRIQRCSCLSVSEDCGGEHACVCLVVCVRPDHLACPRLVGGVDVDVGEVGVGLVNLAHWLPPVGACTSAAICFCRSGSAVFHSSRSSASAATVASSTGCAAGARSGRGSTLYGARFPRVTVSAIVRGLSMCDRWLMRMPPTLSRPNVTFGSRNRVRRRPL